MLCSILAYTVLAMYWQNVFIYLAFVEKSSLCTPGASAPANKCESRGKKKKRGPSHTAFTYFLSDIPDEGCLDRNVTQLK